MDTLVTEKMNSAEFSEEKPSGAKKSKLILFLQYLISFIIPIAGVLIGLLLIASEEKKTQLTGIFCLVLVAFNVVISIIISSI